MKPPPSPPSMPLVSNRPDNRKPQFGRSVKTLRALAIIGVMCGAFFIVLPFMVANAIGGIALLLGVACAVLQILYQCRDLLIEISGKLEGR